MYRYYYIVSEGTIIIILQNAQMDILEETVLRHVSLHTTGFNVVKHVPVKNHHAIMSMDAIPLWVSYTFSVLAVNLCVLMLHTYVDYSENTQVITFLDITLLNFHFVI